MFPFDDVIMQSAVAAYVITPTNLKFVQYNSTKLVMDGIPCLCN